MKLETSEGEREEAQRWYNKDAFFVRAARDIDTLLAEVERLRAGAPQAVAPPAPPLPAEVEEMRGRILVALLHAAIRASNDEAHKMAAYFDSVRDEAASLLSRWPGGWRPIETAPKDKHILVWAPSAHGLSAMFSVCLWHPDGGFCIDELRDPTHWSPLPEPPHE